MSNAIKPKHYQSKIEPIDFILANNLNFLEGNIIKYIARYKNKNGLEDLLKAKDCLKKLINEVKNEKNEVIDNNKETTAIYNIAKYTYETTICYGRLGCNWELHLFKINEELEFCFLKKIEVFNGNGFIGVEFNKDFFERFVYDNIELKKITYENVKFINHSEKLATGGYMFETDNKIFILKPNEKNEAIDNNKETITTYNITNKSDLQMFYDYENDYQIWIVKALEGIFAFSVGKHSKEFIIKILKKQAELSPWLKNILYFLPHISLIHIFYTTEDCSYFYHNHMSINRTFKTTDGIININYTYEN